MTREQLLNAKQKKVPIMLSDVQLRDWLDIAIGRMRLGKYDVTVSSQDLAFVVAELMSLRSLMEPALKN